MFIIITNGKYYKGNKSLATKRKNAKSYQTSKGAKGVISRLKLKKARVEMLTNSEQMDKMSSDFDTNFKYDAKNGIMIVRKNIATPKNRASENIKKLSVLMDAEPYGTLEQVYNKEI